MWDPLLAPLGAAGLDALAFDLPGHGGCSQWKGEITFARCVEHVLARAPGRFALCGYSLGARVALHVALSAPQRVSGLILVSGSPGIEDGAERRRRLEADRALAERIEREGLERFAQRWAELELFAGDPPEVRERVMEDQLRNSPAGLAGALRGLSAGAMEPLWPRLGELRMPCAILAGERDRRYVAIGERMAAEIGGSHLQILAGGHRLAHERPQAVAEHLRRFGAERCAASAGPEPG